MAAGPPRPPDAPAPRSLRAANPSAMTLRGTETYLVGQRRTVVIDPGPALSTHLDAVAAAVADAEAVTLVLTHDHPDHAGGAAALARRLGAPLLAARDGALADGRRIETDAGELVALATPGHTPDHVAFHWPAGDAVFCGDLMMGGQDTALVAPPEGRLGDYLASLRRIEALAPRRVYPAHGPVIEDGGAAAARYVRHRERRQAQVLDALDAGAADLDGIVARVYGGGLDPALRGAAGGAVRAYLEHLEETGRIARAAGGRWRRLAP